MLNSFQEDADGGRRLGRIEPTGVARWSSSRTMIEQREPWWEKNVLLARDVTMNMRHKHRTATTSSMVHRHLDYDVQARLQREEMRASLSKCESHVNVRGRSVFTSSSDSPWEDSSISPSSSLLLIKHFHRLTLATENNACSALLREDEQSDMLFVELHTDRFAQVAGDKLQGEARPGQHSNAKFVMTTTGIDLPCRCNPYTIVGQCLITYRVLSTRESFVLRWSSLRWFSPCDLTNCFRDVLEFWEFSIIEIIELLENMEITKWWYGFRRYEVSREYYLDVPSHRTTLIFTNAFCERSCTHPQ
jgi:hypothetical protein